MDKAEKIKNQVDERVKAENQTGNEKPDGKKLSSSFVKKCLHSNELGDGELFKAKYREIYCLNKSTNEWLFFNGNHWEHDIEEKAFGEVESVSDEYLNLLSDLPEDEFGKKLEKKIVRRVDQLRTTNRQNKILIQAGRGRSSLAVTGERIDQKPYLLPCKNGVVDLETGRLLEGNPKDFLMKASAAVFEGIDAPCPTWDKALGVIFGGNLDMVEYIQRVYGMAAIGEVLESKMFLLVGSGRNGKTTIVEKMAKLFGELAVAVPAELFVDSYRPNSSGPTPDLMLFKGARKVYASETREGDKLSEGRCKWISGDDTIVARSPHDKYPTHFRPSHTTFLMTNRLPKVNGQDPAIWNRLRKIPFDYSFVKDRKPDPENPFERAEDPDLKKKLILEESGIFGWLVKGALMYQREGLNEPDIVREATDAYRRDEDYFGAFKEDVLEVAPYNHIQATIAYKAFEDWYKDNVGNYVPSQKLFGAWAKKEFNDGLNSKVGGERVYLGVKLRDGISLFP